MRQCQLAFAGSPLPHPIICGSPANDVTMPVTIIWGESTAGHFFLREQERSEAFPDDHEKKGSHLKGVLR